MCGFREKCVVPEHVCAQKLCLPGSGRQVIRILSGSRIRFWACIGGRAELIIEQVVRARRTPFGVSPDRRSPRGQETEAAVPRGGWNMRKIRAFTIQLLHQHFSIAYSKLNFVINKCIVKFDGSSIFFGAAIYYSIGSCPINCC